MSKWLSGVLSVSQQGLEDRTRYLQIAKQVFKVVPERQRVLLLWTPMMRGSDVEAVQWALNQVRPSDPGGWVVWTAG